MGSKVVYDSGFLKVEKDQATGWTYVRTTDAVAVLVYVPELDSVVLVVQHRPAVGAKTIEAVAGRLDREATERQIVVSELEEEAGITVDPQDIELLNFGEPLATSPGFATEKKYLAYVEADPSRISGMDKADMIFGNENEGESIERLFVRVSDLKEMKFESLSLFALVQWFLNNKHTE